MSKESLLKEMNTIKLKYSNEYNQVMAFVEDNKNEIHDFINTVLCSKGSIKVSTVSKLILKHSNVSVENIDIDHLVEDEFFGGGQ